MKRFPLISPTANLRIINTKIPSDKVPQGFVYNILVDGVLINRYHALCYSEARYHFTGSEI
jgi:hypothetical protein